MYARPRSQRTESRHQSNKARGGKLVPVMAVPFRPNEKGIVSQQVSVELEPISGRLITDIYATVTCVFVPALAADALLNAGSDYPGNAEVFRQRLLDGEDVFPLEGESEISERLGIVPRSLNGELVVSSVARAAHNVAVNYLRRKKYIKAAQIEVTNLGMTPALISSTALDRFNAVLDPEDRVNGSVTLEGEIPIKGIGLRASRVGEPDIFNSRQSDGTVSNVDGWRSIDADSTPGIGRAQFVIDQDPDNPGHPDIVADFSLGTGQRLSLKDFYQAEKMDKLTRLFQRMVEANPEHGYEQIIRLVHGLEIETGKLPYTVFQRTVSLRSGVKSGMDGPSLDTVQTHTDGVVDYTIPIDGSEFGGVLVTFLEVKPEEVISDQPHPVLTQPWHVDNVAAQELAIHPVPVHMRDLDVNVAAQDEDIVAFWVGPEHFRRSYENYGYNRGVDETTVDHKSAMWRYAIPLSVTPGAVVYPETIDHYPFSLNGPDDDAVSYSCMSSAAIASPTVLGPSPIEELEILDTADVFEEGINE